MKLKVFGAARDILGARELEWQLHGKTVGDLRLQLIKQYPALADLNSLLIAVNQTYGEESTLLNEGDEIALIPPVSGG